ncbi:MAG: hypothetical protein IAB81_02775 [Bacteroidetes bacterium]|uniref:Uncharacterized protein n=1 Tax=Candidatus Merdivivens pullicola TaxID=2840872 RepID=A0A9D9IGS9_9BACT|nr:hypothetical protein [Candidatus Merdivivens pullicola]
MEYHYYMQRYGTADDASQPVMDLETDFAGLAYIESTGLSSKGAPKNIYIEDYAESNESRVYVPETVCRESTEIKLKLGFGGASRRDTFDSFYDYVSQGKVKYWDTLRNRVAYMILNSAVEPSDDVVLGVQPYIIAEFTFTNLFGNTFPDSQETGV